MKKTLILIILMGCKKIDLKDAVSDGAKLTKADAGKSVYSGTWWSESLSDSLVINVKHVKFDSVFYTSNMWWFDWQLTHKLGFEPKDDNLILKNGSREYKFRLEH